MNIKQLLFGKPEKEPTQPKRCSISILQVEGDLNNLGHCSHQDKEGQLALLIIAKVITPKNEQIVQYTFNGFELIRLADSIDLQLSSITEKYAMNSFIQVLRANKLTENSVILPYTILL